MATEKEKKLVKGLKSTSDLEDLLSRAHPLSWFKPGKSIEVYDKMQTKYSYTLTESPGKNFAQEFQPQISPSKMLQMGVFEGKYLNDCVLEFPREWFEGAIKKLSPGAPNTELNAFKIKSRLSLQEWQKRKWIPVARGDKDIRGWFQWYCRYWIGRRDENVDAIQIARWKSFTRHKGQILASYSRLKNPPKTRAEKRLHRPRQRQALLQWAYDPYV